MMGFDKSFISEMEKYEGERVLIYVILEDGIERKYFGEFGVSSLGNMIYLLNDSKKYDPIDGWDSDFKIQLVKASPVVTLLNWMKYEKGNFGGEIVHDDQFRVVDFKIHVS